MLNGSFLTWRVNDIISLPAMFDYSGLRKQDFWQWGDGWPQGMDIGSSGQASGGKPWAVDHMLGSSLVPSELLYIQMRTGLRQHHRVFWEACSQSPPQGNSCEGHRVHPVKPWTAWSSCWSCPVHLERRIPAWTCKWKESPWRKLCVGAEAAAEESSVLSLSLTCIKLMIRVIHMSSFQL